MTTTNTKLSLVRQGERWGLSGWIGQDADFTPLLAEGGVLKLSLDGLTGLSSLGTRRFIDFIDARAGKTEFHECPRIFIDAVNAIPRLLGKAKDASRIRSVFVPYACPTCKSASEVLVDMGSVTLNGHDLEFPEKRCRTCKDALQMEVDPYDYFLFLIA